MAEPGQSGAADAVGPAEHRRRSTRTRTRLPGPVHGLSPARARRRPGGSSQPGLPIRLTGAVSGWCDGGSDGPLAEGTACAAHSGVVRIAVRVRPGSARPGVGGEHDGALVVRVSERAVDGKATAAALALVAAAFNVGRGSVTLVTGSRSQVKILDVAGADPGVLEGLLRQ